MSHCHRTDGAELVVVRREQATQLTVINTAAVCGRRSSSTTTQRWQLIGALGGVPAKKRRRSSGMTRVSPGDLTSAARCRGDRQVKVRWRKGVAVVKGLGSAGFRRSCGSPEQMPTARSSSRSRMCLWCLVIRSMWAVLPPKTSIVFGPSILGGPEEIDR